MFYVILALCAAAAAALDQWTKALAAANLSGRSITLIEGFLQLHYITNDGMALSMLRGGRWLFVAAAVVFFAVVIWAIAKKYVTKRFELWMIALICGGAVGNLIDRIASGQVVDMICVPWFSTFNVADIFITVPAVLLVLYILIFDKELLADKPKKEQSDDDPS